MVMPYKDPARQKEAQAKHYLANKEKYAEANRRARAKRFAEIEKFKRQPCVDCKTSYHPCVMQFDHVNGDKVNDIRWMVRNSSWQDVLDEIEKCELVCANCHALRTYNRFLDNGQLGYYDPA